MEIVEIAASDLEVLLDVVNGYLTENGIESVARYADPSEVQKAISSATRATNQAVSN